MSDEIERRFEQVCIEVVDACLKSTWPLHEAGMWRTCGALSDAGLMYICQEMSRRQLFDGDCVHHYREELVPMRPSLLPEADDCAVEFFCADEVKMSALKRLASGQSLSAAEREELVELLLSLQKRAAKAEAKLEAAAALERMLRLDFGVLGPIATDVADKLSSILDSQ